MVNNYYTLYIESIYALARTIAIKLEDVALAMNLGVINNHPTFSLDQEDPTTWKYYRNVCGLYHPTDTVMTVVSLDDLTVIDFNQATLSSHPLTKKAYGYRSNYYRDLINRYPTQELLILGILYAPYESTFLDYVINSPEGTILYYPDQYVESTESSLIPKLQNWVTIYCRKWINRGYSITDNLYAAVECAQLSLHLVPAIINIRLSLCKTSQVHSYHIKQYLASNGGLDVYLDKLTREQALFLYRNLTYIRNNVGRSEVFDWVVDNIMTLRNLPLYSYTVRHNTYVQLPDAQNPDRLSYYPEIQMVRKSINFPGVDDLRRDKDLLQAQVQLDTVAAGNMIQRVYKDTDLKLRLQLAKSRTTLTKLAESIAVDWNDDVPYTIAEVLFSQWMALAYDNKYLASLTLQINGKQTTAPLSVRDIAILYNYCMIKAQGLTTDLIYPVIIQHCLRRVAPSLEEVRTHRFAQHLSDSDITFLKGLLPTINPVYNVNTFYQHAFHIYTGSIKQHRLFSYWTNVDKSQAGELTGLLCFEDRVLDFVPDGKYSQWLNDVNLDLGDMSPKQYLELATSLFDQVTGYSLYKSASIKEVQAAMLAVLSKLSSYSTLFISDVTEKSVTSSKNKSIKICEKPSIDSSVESVEVPVRDLTNVGTSSSCSSVLELQKTLPWSVKTYDTDDSPVYNRKINFYNRDLYTDSTIIFAKPRQVFLCQDNILAQFNALTDAQKLLISGIY